MREKERQMRESRAEMLLSFGFGGYFVKLCSCGFCGRGRKYDLNNIGDPTSY